MKKVLKIFGLGGGVLGAILAIVVINILPIVLVLLAIKLIFF